MTQRYTVTCTNLPPELGSDTGTQTIDYTADDDTTAEQVETQVRMMLAAQAARRELADYDPDTATVHAEAVT